MLPFFLGVALLSLSTKLLVQILEITVLPALFAHKPGSVYLMQTANQIRHLSSLFLIRYPESLCSLILRPYNNTIGSRTQNHKVAVYVCVCVCGLSHSFTKWILVASLVLMGRDWISSWAIASPLQKAGWQPMCSKGTKWFPRAQVFCSKIQELTRNYKVQSPGSSSSGLFCPETLFKMQARSWEKNLFFFHNPGVMTLEMSNQTRCSCQFSAFYSDWSIPLPFIPIHQVMLGLER